MRRRKNYYLFFGFSISSIMLALAVTSIFWTPYPPNLLDSSSKLLPPSLYHILGADNFGRDIFSRIIAGMGMTVFISASTVAFGAIAGLFIGGLTGYFGGWLDEILMRLSDVITAFPSILLALVMISILGHGKYNVIITLGILFIPSFSRVARSELVRCRQMDYVHSARIMGAGHLRIIFIHILPNTMPVMLRSIAIGFNNAVLAEASMSYLGIGVQPPDPSLGRMLSESQPYLFSAPWYSLSAGISIVLILLGLGLLSEGISD